MRTILIIPLLILGLSACTVYKIDIQQGNTIDEHKLAQLRTGMTEHEVKFLLGNAMLIDPFHSKRWEYIYAYRKGGDETIKQKRLTLYFENGVLAKIDESELKEKVINTENL